MADDRQGIVTAQDAGLWSCRRCGLASPAGTPDCPRCGAALPSLDHANMSRVWAWWFAGLVAFIPANLYPMLQTNFLGRSSDSTIIGGVIDLLHHGSYGIAAIVFFASIMIPIGKFIAILYLGVTIRRKSAMSGHNKTLLYEVVEFIGRWSMIDVFVVAILAALVNLGFVMAFKPGIAAFFFALSVAFTMLSALSFDPRLLWAYESTSEPEHE